MSDHYLTLGVHRSASPAAIRAAWLSAAKASHPDTAGPASAARFKAAAAAYAVLSQPPARRAYDASAP